MKLYSISFLHNGQRTIWERFGDDVNRVWETTLRAIQSQYPGETITDLRINDLYKVS